MTYKEFTIVYHNRRIKVYRDGTFIGSYKYLSDAMIACDKRLLEEATDDPYNDKDFALYGE